jgi:stage II sporulation protein GA (sporulation sigma-E factor processing peptidase)
MTKNISPSIYNIREVGMMVIYADVLVCINIVITYIFLVCVRVFTNLPTMKLGVAIASMVGGAGSLIIFLGDVGIFFTVGYRLVLGAVIVAVAFLPRSIRSSLKVSGAFYGVSFLFGGAVFFLQITTAPHNILYYNGTVYFDMSIKYLIGVIFVVYGLFLAFDYFLSRHVSKHHIYTVDITFRDITVRARGMVDTGNTMKDGISGSPVFVAEVSSVSSLFSYEELDFIRRDFTCDVPETLVGRFRLIPCRTVSGGGLLPAITPDRVRVYIDKRACSIPVSVVAVTSERLSDGEYDILLTSSIYDYQWKETRSGEQGAIFSEQNKS